MYKLNKKYQSLQENYLFAEVTKKVDAYTKENPRKQLISLGIGDVTRPLVPAVTEALHQAVSELKREETFRGYGPTNGYDFLRNIIAKEDYQSKGIEVEADEVFISDGAKSDLGNIQELLSESCCAAVCNPGYPVYMETNVMAGRDIMYLPCNKENGFVPQLPEQVPDVIYLCVPNNPTGAVMKKEQLQEWVDYANKNQSLIIFDAAYEAYIDDEEIPHSIYECKGARTCAIEIRSFSKNAGFTGLRLGAMILPKELPIYKLWCRRQSVRYNGTPYIIQRAGEAIYSPEGKRQIRAQIDYYKRNASIMRKCLTENGYEVYGGKHAPYLWVKTPKNKSSWEFFDELLVRARVICTPGVGFGTEGEGYVRLSAFNSYENTIKAMKRMGKV